MTIRRSATNNAKSRPKRGYPERRPTDIEKLTNCHLTIMDYLNDPDSDPPDDVIHILADETRNLEKQIAELPAEDLADVLDKALVLIEIDGDYLREWGLVHAIAKDLMVLPLDNQKTLREIFRTLTKSRVPKIKNPVRAALYEEED